MGFVTWIQYDCAENMVDGVALQNLTPEDIALMLPGKVGAARKLTVLLQQKKVRCSSAKLCILYTGRVPWHGMCPKNFMIISVKSCIQNLYVHVVLSPQTTV